jgi:hypothetical protein
VFEFMGVGACVSSFPPSLPLSLLFSAWYGADGACTHSQNPFVLCPKHTFLSEANVSVSMNMIVNVSECECECECEIECCLD